MTKDKRLIQERSDCNKVSNLSESGWIATDFTKEGLIKYKNKYKYRQRFGIGQRTGSGARGLEPTKDQKPTAEALGSEGWYRKIKS